MDVIIVGAGAAGLMAAKKLSQAGLKVHVLEARDRLGGRIYTISNLNSTNVIEGGAEFIHGNLKVTLDLLKEAATDKQEIKGETWQVTNGTWGSENDFFAHADVVIKHLKALKEDISIAQFIKQFFAEDKYIRLRKSLTSYIEGYYLGKTEQMSAKAFLKEWMSEDEQQYRPEGGYGKMINHLAETCEKAGVTIQLSTVVKEIKWQKGNVEVIDDRQNSYVASKAIITVPLGIWRAEENTGGAIMYSPALPLKVEAAKQMGFGFAIKILLEFKEIFWEDSLVKDQIKIDTADLQFIISDSAIPVWWTQLPQHNSLLTGWLTGCEAERLKNEKEDVIMQQSLGSLANIFGIDSDILQEKLKWYRVFNWANDPFSRGSYSYSAVQTKAARKILMEPVQNKLFFAGEALYEGTETGTVEAALTSGLTAAEILMA